MKRKSRIFNYFSSLEMKIGWGAHFRHKLGSLKRKNRHKHLRARVARKKAKVWYQTGDAAELPLRIRLLYSDEPQATRAAIGPQNRFKCRGGFYINRNYNDCPSGNRYNFIIFVDLRKSLFAIRALLPFGTFRHHRRQTLFPIGEQDDYRGFNPYCI